MDRPLIITRLVIFLLGVFWSCAYIHGQPQQSNPVYYDTVYLLHLKSFQAYYYRVLHTPKDSPLHVLSRDTMLIEVNDTCRYLSPGIKRQPDFNLGIRADVVQVLFPKGTTLSVRFSTEVDWFKKDIPLSLRQIDTTFQITPAEKQSFYFISYRYIPKFGRRPKQFYWRLYHDSNTRKHLARRLNKKLNTHIVHTIRIE
jgi:hypothetical protein